LPPVSRHTPSRGGPHRRAHVQLAKSAHINLSNCWIPIVSALLIWALHVNPIWIIIAAGVGGYVYGKMKI
jgi:hypothetical protein